MVLTALTITIHIPNNARPDEQDDWLAYWDHAKVKAHIKDEIERKLHPMVPATIQVEE